jgi:hypothetical protein
MVSVHSTRLNVASVILSAVSLVCFALGCFSSFSGDETMMETFSWMQATETSDHNWSSYHFSLKGFRVVVHSPEIPHLQIGFADSACVATYCDVCNNTGSAAYLVNIVAATMCVTVAVMSGISVKSFSKNRQIAAAALSFGVAAISSASTILYMVSCYRAIYEVAETLHDNPVSLAFYQAPYPYWSTGAFVTLHGVGVMWIVTILLVIAERVSGAVNKTVPATTEAMDSPAEVPKRDVHYA